VRVAGIFSSTYVVEGVSLSPYGPVPAPVTINNVTVNNFYPPPPRDDLSGVDLDLGPPPWKPPVQAKRPPAPEPPQVKPPPPPKPKVEPPEPREPALPAAPEPFRDPRREAVFLIETGLRDFTAKHYGLAALRFRQAALVDRNSALGRFYLAQAYVALGKYREAVVAIQEGMDLNPAWPRGAFRPRVELYHGIETDFADHLRDLQAALARSPDNRFLLFLTAYELWLDGRHKDAEPLFLRARAVTLDPSYIDRFLRAVPGGEVAAR
jgi:hypothetical protein